MFGGCHGGVSYGSGPTLRDLVSVIVAVSLLVTVCAPEPVACATVNVT
jgi:hypothetical protein